MLEILTENARLRLEAISEQNCVSGNFELAAALDKRGLLKSFGAGTEFIKQGDESTDIFFILSGECEINVNGRTLAKRGPRQHVGEMAALQPTQPRSATCVASENVVALQISAVDLAEIGDNFPSVYRAFAKELSRRLIERNKSVNSYRDKVRIFIISSVEALPIARLIQTAFEHDSFTTVIWTDGVFRVANYPIESLEEQIDTSDFAIAIAHADDVTSIRGQEWPAPRDNVIFELGLFLGRLGRARAILMEPREEKVKLPSDLTGVTTIAYRFEPGSDAAALMAPSCNRLRDHILALGPNNG